MLPILTFPDPRLKQKALEVDFNDPELPSLIKSLTDAVIHYNTYGLNAPMFGISKSIIVLNSEKINSTGNLVLSQETPKVILNIKMIELSSEKQIVEEGNPCFPNIRAPITRPSHMTFQYQDLEGNLKEFKAQGFLSTVIQHQWDHLLGKCFLDHLSKIKKDLMIKKMVQSAKQTSKTHVHGPHCQH